MPILNNKSKNREVIRVSKIMIQEFKIPYQYQNLIHLAVREGYEICKKDLLIKIDKLNS